MKDLDFFHVDAFTSSLFGGNPACVIPLKEWLSDELLLKIAKENGLPETVFFVNFEDHFHIRWFTPDLEMDLCGHATLATAYVLATHLGFNERFIRFESKSGLIEVEANQGKFTLALPIREGIFETLPEEIYDSLSAKPDVVLKARDFMLVYENEQAIRDIQIDKSLFDKVNLGHGGVIFTAPGDKVDFVSRFFTPQSTIFEDPVTGSAHCTLIPYWSKRLNKRQMRATQLSARVGDLECELGENNVFVTGSAVLYSKGIISLPVH